MPTLPDDPLRRVTLNLYEADVMWLIKTYGSGWTVRIRGHIHNEVLNRQVPTLHGIKIKRPTLGDLTSGYEHKDPTWPDDLGETDDDQ